MRLLRDQRRVVAARRLLSKWGVGTYQAPRPLPAPARSGAGCCAVTLRLKGRSLPRKRGAGALPQAGRVTPARKKAAGPLPDGADQHLVDEWVQNEFRKRRMWSIRVAGSVTSL